MPVIRVADIEEFTRRTDERDFEICKHIYEAIQKAIKRNIKTVKVFDLVLDADPLHKYSFSLSKDQWKTALNSCLDAYTAQELYEECTQIKSIINSL